MVPVGRMGLCWPGIALSVVWGAGVGGWACGLCTKSRARPGHASPSEVYPAGKLQ